MVKITCPSCGYGRTWKLRREKRKCKKCRKEFSGKFYPVNGFRITQKVWNKSIHVFLRERTVLRISQETGVSLKTAQRMTHHMRICMSQLKPDIFYGPIELDETYIGGQRKNKKLHIRRKPCKRGHGTDKLPMVGLFDRDSGRVLVEVEPRKLNMPFILKFLSKQVKPGAEIYTDGYKMYRMLPSYGYEHEYVDHAHNELVRGEVHTNNIEGFWGILKRKLGCIGGMRRERLHLFVTEIAWKYNHRKLTLKEQEEALKKLIFDE